MRKLIIILFILISSNVYAGAPSRSFSYTSGTTIESSKVTTNEDNIFNYLSAGVEVYKDDTIVNADINSSAAIANSKLNLNTISQNITHSGTLTQSGTLTSTGTASFTSAAFTTITDLGNVTTTGTVTTGGKLTTTGQTVTGNLFDINGGTVDSITSLTAANNLDIGAYEMRALTFESDQATGTAPFTVASTTTVTNLDADTVDGSEASDLQDVLGSWTTAVENTSTVAATDGFLLVYVTANTSDTFIKTDAANPPTVVRTGTFTTDGDGMMCPVKKGEYYLIENASTGDYVSYWIPLD